MKNKWFTYIKICEKENYIQTSGLTFNEFYNGIDEKPQNILILKGYPKNATFNKKISLEYISSEFVKDFTDTNVYRYGDFCWFDFDNVEQINSLSNAQLAELLFFSHMTKPLDSYQISGLNNKYAYNSHDDDWFVRVYMKDTKSYLSVIEYKILRELKGRKKYIAPLTDTILKQIYDFAKGGAVIDFEESYLTGVHIYKIGAFNDIDSIHRTLDKRRENLGGLCLYYDTKLKKWNIY